MKSACALLVARAPLSDASLMCVPVAHARNSLGDALLILATKCRSWNDTLPAPPPPPAGAAAWLAPIEYDCTSISPLWAACSDSPGMPSSLRNQRSSAITSKGAPFERSAQADSTRVEPGPLVPHVR